MRSLIYSHHWNDENGNPAGGNTYGNGFAIAWQNGPLGRGIDRKVPNGAFVEDIIFSAINRLEFYQNSKFACEENAEALKALRFASEWLDSRTLKRDKRGVEGTHAI